MSALFLVTSCNSCSLCGLCVSCFLHFYLCIIGMCAEFHDVRHNWTLISLLFNMLYHEFPKKFSFPFYNYFTPKLPLTYGIYLDDVLVFSKTQEEHLEHIRKVFDIRYENKLYAKLTNCCFAKNELEYLGHVMGKDGIKVDPRKIDTVTRWTRSNDVSQLRLFLGLSNYFRQFIQGYSTLVVLLTRLTRKDVTYIWIDKCQESFEGVKYALTHAPVLSLSIFGERFEVICDASLLDIGTILL